MDSEVKAQNIALNQFCKRMNEQYHAYAVHCGLSDPALWVLYSLWEADTILTQNDICSLWMYPKQTINFTISGLVKKGLLQLADSDRRTLVALSEKQCIFFERELQGLLQCPEE